MTTQLLTRPLILGTAGHIDHGKTALVRAMTGVDTDRLPEEKQRGITIDIGFASIGLGDVQLGIVDVPGHERFIKNMLAGATGIDVALLVVAADDSVMPQTREHLDILRLLDVNAGVIAISKVDLPDPDWLDLVEEDVRQLVKGTFLQDAPVVRTSAITGQGIDELKAVLADACSHVRESQSGSMFRLAIDRAFVLQGHGTVVTGTVWSGRAAVGDVLALQPAGQAVRIRSLESHGEQVNHVERGQRAAIGLTGVHHSDIARGNEIATPGYLKPSKLVTVRLRVLPSSPWPIKHRARVRLHVGTSEVMASVSLLQGEAAAPGQTVDAQLALAKPVTATCGQPFVIRSESPLLTIGGGHILQPTAKRMRRCQTHLIGRLDALAGDDPLRRAAGALYFLGLRDWSNADLCRDANIQLDIAEDLDALKLTISPTRVARLHRDVFNDLQSRLLTAVKYHHAAHPLQAGIPRQQLLAAVNGMDDGLLRAVIAQLIDAKLLEGDDDQVHLPGFAPQLSFAQRRQLTRIVGAYQTGRYQPPTAEELVDDQTPPALVRQLVELAAGQRELVHLGSGLYLHAEHEQAMREKIAGRLSHVSGLTVAQIRDLLGTSRKFAVPICEYLDRVGCTRRDGDMRVAGSARDT